METELMSDVIGFLEVKGKLLRDFGCTDDLFIKPLLDHSWFVSDSDGFYMLSYWKKGGSKQNAVIVKKNNAPAIFRNGGLVMILAIECVKLGFIFNDALELTIGGVESV